MTDNDQPFDAHAHVASPDAKRFPRSGVFPRAPQFGAPVELLLADMDAAGVGRALLIQPSLYGFDHAYLMDSLRAHPQRFVGLALANPADPAFVGELAEMARVAPLAGVRLAPLIDPSLPWFGAEADPLARTLADLDMAVGLLIAPTHLDAASAWISRWPQIRFVIDHAGRPDLDEDKPDAACERLARLAELPNVWVKLSALNELSREAYPHRDTAIWARRMLAAFGPERLMWGTDFPFVSGKQRYAESLSSLREALDEAAPGAYRQIVAGTAAQVFRATGGR
jgi:predicted TIM-barrel fold metal-dependent hydrolase